jgi:hypothetical protein
MSNENDPLVVYNGQVMPLSQALALQRQAIQNYENEMAVTIDSLYSLNGALGGHAAEVWSAKSQLDSDMTGIDGAIGTDDTGNQIRKSWNQNYPSLLAGFDQLASNIDDLATSMQTAGDQLYKTECDNLKGFNVTPPDPRPAYGRPGYRRPNVS